MFVDLLLPLIPVGVLLERRLHGPTRVLLGHRGHIDLVQEQSDRLGQPILYSNRDQRLHLFFPSNEGLCNETNVHIN